MRVVNEKLEGKVWKWENVNGWDVIGWGNGVSFFN